MQHSSFFLISVLIGISFLGGCKKDKTSPDIQGYVYDATTNDLVPGANVYYYEQENSPNWVNPYPVLRIDQTTTDNNGKFSLKRQEKDNYSYFISAASGKYYGSDTTSFASENPVNIYLKPEGFLRVIIKNTQPVDSTDYIKIDSFGTPAAGGVEFYGAATDTFTLARCMGNKKTALHWIVIKNADTTVFSFSVYCPAFDTTDYPIDY